MRPAGLCVGALWCIHMRHHVRSYSGCTVVGPYGFSLREFVVGRDSPLVVRRASCKLKLTVESGLGTLSLCGAILFESCIKFTAATCGAYVCPLSAQVLLDN